MTIPRRDLNAGIAEALTESTGRPITVMEGPTTSEPQGLAGLFPYAYLEPLPGATFMTTLARAYPLVSYGYAVISCGQTVEQAEALADRVRDRLLKLSTNPIPIDGYSIAGTEPDGGPDTPEKIGLNFWSVRESYTFTVSKG